MFIGQCFRSLATKRTLNIVKTPSGLMIRKLPRPKATAYTQFRKFTNPLYPMRDRLHEPFQDFRNMAFLRRQRELAVYAREAARKRKEYRQKFVVGRDKRKEAAEAKAPARRARMQSWLKRLDSLERGLNFPENLPPAQLDAWNAKQRKKRLLKRLRGNIRLKLASRGQKTNRQRRIGILLKQIQMCTVDAKSFPKNIDHSYDDEKPSPVSPMFIQTDEELDAAVNRIAFVRNADARWQLSGQQMQELYRDWQKQITAVPAHLREDRVEIPANIFPDGLYNVLSKKHKRKLAPLVNPSQKTSCKAALEAEAILGLLPSDPANDHKHDTDDQEPEINLH